MNKRILLISPQFFNYSDLIICALKERGFEVDWYSDRNKTSTFGKAILRLKKTLLKRSIDNYLSKVLEGTKNRDYDYILVVNGEVLTSDFIKQLRSRHTNAKFILYMWDSLDNFPSSKVLIKCFDSCYSFDRSDCSKYGLKFLPLFYYEENCLDEFIKTPKRYDYCFIGTVKKGKYRYLRLILDELDSHFTSSFKYLYIQSRLVYLFYKIKYRKEFKGAKVSMFRYKRFPPDRCRQIEMQSKMIVDVVMGEQEGLTIRTFETLARGQKLITSNTYISGYDFFNRKNIYVFDKNKKIDFDNEFFCDDNVINENLVKKYYIQNWLDTILEN